MNIRTSLIAFVLLFTCTLFYGCSSYSFSKNINYTSIELSINATALLGDNATLVFTSNQAGKLGNMNFTVSQKAPFLGERYFQINFYADTSNTITTLRLKINNNIVTLYNGNQFFGKFQRTV